jgi:peptidoglycan/LPS O-acetylase OafA/YrhL
MIFNFKTVSLAQSKKHYDVVFDSARGWGCFIVFLFHTNLVQSSSYRTAFLTATSIALPVFFIFSAYILIGSNLERGLFTFKTAMGFYITRFFRIFPTWWLYLFFAGLFYQPEFKHLIANAFMYFGFGFWDSRYNFTIVGWSLFVEEFFYWFFPLWATTLVTLKRSIIGFLITWIVFVFWRLIASAHPLPDNPFWYNQSPFNFLDIFLVGIVVHHFWKTKYIELLKDRKVVFVLDALLVITIVVLPFSLMHFVPIGLFLLLVRVEHSLLRKFLLSACSFPMRSIGVFCFSFYLYHSLIISFTSNYASELLNYPWLKIIIDFCFTWIVAKASYELVERPTHLLGYKVATKYLQKK